MSEMFRYCFERKVVRKACEAFVSKCTYSYGKVHICCVLLYLFFVFNDIIEGKQMICGFLAR